MKKLSILIFILVAILLAWFSRVYFTSNIPIKTQEIKPQTVNAPVPLTEEILSQFSTTIIEKKCPFYKPNGAEYRECLSTWVSALERKLLVEQVDEVQNYCISFTKQYADENSIEGAELYLKCKIYKLQ